MGGRAATERHLDVTLRLTLLVATASSSHMAMTIHGGDDNSSAHDNVSAVECPVGTLIAHVLLQGGRGGATTVPFRRCVHQIYGSGESPLLGLGLVFQFFFDLHRNPSHPSYYFYPELDSQL
jgi:hypothetical protein